MLIDHRIYATVLALSFVGSLLSCGVGLFTVSQDDWQRRASIAFAVSAGAGLVTVLTAYFDWLWS